MKVLKLGADGSDRLCCSCNKARSGVIAVTASEGTLSRSEILRDEAGCAFCEGCWIGVLEDMLKIKEVAS